MGNREKTFAGFRRGRANVVAPVRLPRQHVVDEHGARAPVRAESGAELVGVERARELAPPRGHDQRLGALRRHGRVPGGELRVGLCGKKSRQQLAHGDGDHVGLHPFEARKIMF
jgi:hypothetical protein